MGSAGAGFAQKGGLAGIPGGNMAGLSVGGGQTGTATGNTNVTNTAERSFERKRTEFIIVLYWVEPLPTEPEEAKAGGAAAAAPQ
jgi:hypothetical protein